jgi:hypothetical protein
MTTETQLLAFVQQIARLTKNYECQEHPNASAIWDDFDECEACSVCLKPVHDPASDDAFETLDGLISQARELVGC